MRQTRSRLGCRGLGGLLAIVLAWWQCVPPSFAAEFHVFKKTYVRDAGTPGTVTDAFTVLNPDTSWTLRAINGSLEDTTVEKVSSSILKLNGVEILKPNQFSQNVNVIQAPVLLLSSNSVATQLRSKPGGQLTVEIVGQDDAPPTVQWLTPSPSQSFNTQAVIARLRLTDDIAGLDPASLEILLDGIPVQGDFSPLTQSVLGATLEGNLTVTDGPHTLYAQVRDRAGQLANASVSFSVLTGPPVTPESGFIHGSVFHAVTEQPLADATISVRGIAGNLRSGADGRFQFPTPGSGEFVVEIAKEGFTPVQRNAQVLTSHDVAVEPAFLTPLDPAVTLITPEVGGLATDSSGNFQVEFPPGAAPGNLEVRITPLHDERQLPGPIPEGRDHVEAVYFEPRFTTFNTPAVFRVRNTKGFPPNTTINLELWNEQEQRWMDVDPGTVTPDGQWVQFPIIRFFCWYCWWLPRRLPAGKKAPHPQAAPRLTTEAKDSSKPCEVEGHSAICLDSGNLAEQHTLPAVRTLGQSRSLTFTYRSTTASPSVLIGTDYFLDTVGDRAEGPTIVPVSTSATIQIEGQRVEASFTGSGGSLRQAFLWDGRNARGQLLSTGAYPYTVELSNNYQATFGDTGVPIGGLVPLTTPLAARAILVNQRESVFGAGWALERFQRLFPQADGTVFVTDGDGSATVFRPGPMADLAVANFFAGGNVSVLHGHGDGTFQPQQKVAVSSHPSPLPIWVAAGDVNGDGFQDLATALARTGEVAILLGLGGAFQPPQRHAVGDSPQFVTMGDFNGDGAQDLVTANLLSNDVSILLGNGDGTFQPHRRVAVGAAPVSVALADFNRDGFLDFATTNFGSDASVVLGNGDGTFQAERRLAVGRATSIVAADFNRDGMQDLATANALFDNDLSVLLGNGDGTFQPQRRFPGARTPSAIAALAVGDFNRDGVPDLAETGFDTGHVAVLLGIGDGSFQTLQQFPTSGGPSSLVVKDFNQDGMEDLAVSNVSGEVSILLSRGDGTFQRQLRFPTVPGGPGAAGIAVGEFNDRLGAAERTFSGLPGDFSRLVQHPDGALSRILTNGTRIEFDSRGVHQRTVDRNGNETRYRYDAVDRLMRVEFPGGAAFDFSYSPLDGHLTSVTDSAGRTTQFLVNGDANLRRITNPDGTIRQFAYDAGHHLISQIAERGFTTTYTYDAFGRIQEAVLPERPVFNPPIGSVTPQREVRRFTPSDTQGLINALAAGVGTPDNPAPPVPTPLANFQDGQGHTTQLATDRFGAPTKLIDPLGRTTTIERDVNGLPTKIVRPNGAESIMTYDSRGNLTSMRADAIHPAVPQFPQRIVHQFEYDPTFSQVTKLIDARRDSPFDPFPHPCEQGCTTTIDHDATGNPLRIIDHLGNVTSFTYDSRGLLLTGTDALGNLTPDIPTDHQVRFTFDPVTGNLLSSSDQLGNATSLSYDSFGNVAISTDAENHPTTFTYDALNRLTAVSDALGGFTRYAYDPGGNLASVTDARGQTTTFSYDSLNQLASTTNPANQTKQFFYDLNRNLGKALDAKGQTIAFLYDAANQLKTKILRDSADAVQDTVLYDYDALGNLTLVQDSDSKLTFEYDSIGQLIKANTGDPANPAFAQPVTSVQYSYDPNGNRASITGADFTGAGYHYDGLNRLIIRNEFSLADKAFEYDALSRVTRMTGGPISTFSYDDASQLLSLNTTLLGNPLESFAYTYDPRGNRRTLTDRVGLHEFGYDALNRLARADHPLASGLVDEVFTYDPVGNRLTSHLSATHRTDAANRLLEDDTFTYTYDANGNLTSKTEKLTGAVTTYTYDVENQLVTLHSPLVTASYRYDGLGRRIQKDVNSTLTRFVYDQEDVLALYDGTGCWQAGFFHGPGLDEPFALIRDDSGNCTANDAVGFREQLRFLQTDGLGSITSLISETSGFFRALLLKERYTYDSFGSPTITGPGPDDQMDTADDVTLPESALGNPFLFTGREFDSESGLYYHRGRYRDPRTGRFLQEDRLNGDDVHPQQQYLYAEGNPVNLVDPWGETAIALPVGLGAVCVTTVAGALICAAGAVALAVILAQANKSAQELVAKTRVCPVSKTDSSKDFPANPDDWVPPEGVKEEPKAKEATGGKHRQWKDASGKPVRRWDRGEPGKPGWRGRDHWNDEHGRHIVPGSQ